MPPASPTPDTRSTYGTGLALIALGGITLSVDIPMIRLSGSSIWTVLFLRGLMAGLVVLAVWLAQSRLSSSTPPLVAGRSGLLVTGLYALSSACFVLSVFNTDAANVVFILALNPMFGAILSFLIIGERPSLPTLLAIPLTLLGIGLIIGAGLEAGNWLGDLAALGSAFLIALAVTLNRRSGRDMRYASALGMVPCALVAAPFALTQGLQSEAMGWLLANGALILPLSMICLSFAPRFVPAPVVGMGYLLETVLAPVWVWLVFREFPGPLALVGGGIVVAAIVGHSLLELSARRRGAPVTA